MGCVPVSPEPVPIGIQRLQSGMFEVLAALCPGEQVLRVRVEHAPEDAEVTLLWEASQPTSMAVRNGQFTIGGAGQFVEVTTPLLNTLSGQVEVILSTNQTDIPLSVDLNDYPQNNSSAYWDGAALSEPQALRNDLAHCPPPQ